MELEEIPYRQQIQMQEMLGQEQSRVMTEDASYHSIRIYNMIRDRLWEYLDLINSSPTLEEMSKHMIGARLLLLRGDKVWMEIKKAIDEKKKSLKVNFTPFLYDNELKKAADGITVYYELITKGRVLATLNQQNAIDFLQMPTYEKLTYIKHNIEQIITEADEKWGGYAATIGFTMPIEVKEAHDPFF